MGSIALELIFLFLLILLNGVLAMSELAVVSARKPRLQHMADGGSTGARLALELAKQPGHFLSTVQIGITLVGVFAGAFGGVTVARWLAEMMGNVPLLAPYAQPVSMGIVVVTITYLSLVLGELVPKRLALRDPEQVASLIAPPMKILARIANPLVRLLNVSSEGVLRFLGIQDTQTSSISEEEIRLMLTEATEQGVFEPMEEEMVDQVFRLADRTVGALLTPRPEIYWLDRSADLKEIRQVVINSGRSRFPVADGELDQVIGVVLAKDLLAQSLMDEPLNLDPIVRPALFVPESAPALTVIERFKQTHSKLAIVIDEYGGVEGLVTVDDIMEAIVGDIPEPDEAADPDIVQREDGSWLVDGLYAVDNFQELFGLQDLPEEFDTSYQTVGGFVMTALGHVPSPGDQFPIGSILIEVVDMDGRRVDKILVTRQEVEGGDDNISAPDATSDFSTMEPTDAGEQSAPTSDQHTNTQSDPPEDSPPGRSSSGGAN